jgi:hypothetical protein
MSRLADRYAILFLAVTVLSPACLGADRRSDPRGGGAGCSDALSAHSGGTGRDRFRALACGQLGILIREARRSRCWRR